MTISEDIAQFLQEKNHDITKIFKSITTECSQIRKQLF